MRLRELLTETPFAILKALGGMIGGATKAKHYPTGNLDQLKRIHQSANTATKAGTDTAKHTELADAIAMRDLATQNVVAQRNVLGNRTSIKHNKELEAAENKLLDMQKTINDKTNDLLINKDLGPTQPSNSGMARWNDHSDTQGVLAGSSKGSMSKYATPAEQRRYTNLFSKEWHRERIANSTPKELAAYNAKQAAASAKRKANMTPKELAAFNAKEAATAAKRKANWTPEELATYNAKHVAYRAKRKANMTPEELAEYNAKEAADYVKWRAKKKAKRMENDPEYAAKVSERERRANMTPEERKANMTPEELAEFNTKKAVYDAKKYAQKKEKRMKNDPVYAAKVREKERKANMPPKELTADKVKKAAASNVKTRAKQKAKRMKNDPVYAAKVREKERRANLTPAERKAETKAIKATQARERYLKNKNKKK